MVKKREPSILEMLDALAQGYLNARREAEAKRQKELEALR